MESRGDGWSMTDQGGAEGTREPGRASGLTGHGGELGARSHGGTAGSMGRGGVQDSEARDPPATLTMETGKPVVLALDRWWAEGEQRGCQMTAVEEAGAGGDFSLRAAKRSRSPTWAEPGNGSPLCVRLRDKSPLRAKLWNWNPLWAKPRNRNPLLA